jgi:hypothetical protein
MDVRVERKYEVFFMPREGEDMIFLTRDLFPKRHDVGFSRSDISVRFSFREGTMEHVTISSKASVVCKKTLRQVESEDEEEVKNFLKIRCLKDLREYVMFMTPLEKKKVKKLLKSSIVLKSKVWQWDYSSYCDRLVRNEMPELDPKTAMGLMTFLKGRRKK